MSAPQPRKLRLAVLLSGSGTTLENIFARAERDELPAEGVLVISTLSRAYGLERARRRGVPTAVFVRKKFSDDESYSQAVFARLREAKPDLVVLAGFMVRLLIPEDFAGGVMNVHPALIPAFCGPGLYGHHVHEAVLASGEQVTGCTVHFVDDEYDHGPIILQRRVEVQPDDTPETLAERVQREEREAYPEAIRLFAAGRLKIEGGKVRILPAGGTS